jgi:hypothetical protein
MTIKLAGVPEAVRRLVMDIDAERVWALGHELWSVDNEDAEGRTRYHYATVRAAARRDLYRVDPYVIGDPVAGQRKWRRVRLSPTGHEVADLWIERQQAEDACQGGAS